MFADVWISTFIYKCLCTCTYACTLQFSSLLSVYCTVSGIVAELSPEAAEKSGLAEGDRVFALIGGGGYAGELLGMYSL